ncbi:hypothetical protein, partial [Chitinophaga sp.]|uniref:hypothetical protein n=1 Tax=Chitinophaga sp. TaxID=1869181 RepID=UPI002D195E24
LLLPFLPGTVVLCCSLSPQRFLTTLAKAPSKKENLILATSRFCPYLSIAYRESFLVARTLIQPKYSPFL